MKKLIFKEPIEVTRVESLYIYESKHITFAAIRSFQSKNVPYSFIFAKFDNEDGSILNQAQMLGQAIILLESALGAEYEGYPREDQLSLQVNVKILPTMRFQGAMKFEYLHSTNVKNLDTHYYVGFQYTTKAKRGIIHSDIAQSQCSSYEKGELSPVQLTLKYFHKKEDMTSGQIKVNNTCIDQDDHGGIDTLRTTVSYPRGEQRITKNESTSPNACIESQYEIDVYYEEDPETIGQTDLTSTDYLKIDFSDQITSTVDIRKFQSIDQKIESCKNVKFNPELRVSNQSEKISCKLNEPCSQKVADYFFDGCKDQLSGTVWYEMTDVNVTLLTTQTLFPKWHQNQSFNSGKSFYFIATLTNSQEIGSHLIKISAAFLVEWGIIYEYYEDVYFTLEIYDDCSQSLKIFQNSEATKDQLYIIGDKTLTIADCIGQESYKFIFIDNNNIKVKMPSSITNNLDTNKFDVYTNNSQDVNRYEIIHRYTVQYYQFISTKSVSFFLTIATKQEQFIIENTAPYFIKRPLDLKIFATDSQDYYFPSMLDLENDTIKIEWSADSAQTFCVLHEDYLSISPSIKNIGVHEIELILIDNNVKPLKTKYKMTITVVIDPDTIPFELEDLNEDYKMAKKLEISGFLSAKILKLLIMPR
eukprot:403339375